LLTGVLCGFSAQALADFHPPQPETHIIDSAWVRIHAETYCGPINSLSCQNEINACRHQFLSLVDDNTFVCREGKHPELCKQIDPDVYEFSHDGYRDYIQNPLVSFAVTNNEASEAKECLRTGDMVVANAAHPSRDAIIIKEENNKAAYDVKPGGLDVSV